MIHKYVYKDQAPDKALPKIKTGAMYIEKDGRLDVADVYNQIAWYQQQGLVDKDADPSQIVDNSFIKPLTLP